MERLTRRYTRSSSPTFSESQRKGKLRITFQPTPNQSRSPSPFRNLTKDDQAVVKVGPVLKPPCAPSYRPAILKGDRYPFTAGHGPYCECGMCYQYFRFADGSFLPLGLQNPAYMNLVQEQLLPPMGKPSSYAYPERMHPLTTKEKMDHAKRMGDVLADMDEWLSVVKLQRYMPAVAATGMYSRYPNINTIIVDECGIVARNKVCDYYWELSKESHFGQRSLIPELKELWPQCLAVSVDRMDFDDTKQHMPKRDRPLTLLAQSINLISDFNRFTYKDTPLRVYFICGEETFRRHPNHAGPIICKWIRDNIDCGKKHLTWLGTGLGKPVSRSREYQRFNLYMGTHFRSTTSRSYDIFHGRFGRQDGHIMGHHVRNTYTQELKPFILTGDPKFLPIWTGPIHADNYRPTPTPPPPAVQNWIQRQNADQDVLRRVSRELNRLTPTRKASCTHCTKKGHSTQGCQRKRRMDQDDSSNARPSSRQTSKKTVKSKVVKPRRPETTLSETSDEEGYRLDVLFGSWMGETPDGDAQT